MFSEYNKQEEKEAKALLNEVNAVNKQNKELIVKCMDLQEQLRIQRVSQQRELLEAFTEQIKKDNELTETVNFQDINKFLASNCG